MTMDYLASEWARRHISQDNYGEIVGYCRNLPDEYHDHCIKGTARGYFNGGSEPEKEYIKAVDFCSSTLLTNEERKACSIRI